MNNQVKKSKLTLVIIGIALLVIIGVVFACLFIASASDKSYEGIYVGEVYVGGMSKADIEKKLSDEYGKYDLNPRFDYNGKQFQIYGSQINLSADFIQSAEEAVSYGKDGTIFGKISNVLSLRKNPIALNVVTTCDIDLLQYSLSENLGEDYIGTEQYRVEYGEDCLIVTNGKKGRGVDNEKIIDAISENLTQKNLSEPIKIIIEDIFPDEIDPQAFCEKYNCEAKDAECTSDGEELKIIPEVIGVIFDTDEAIRIINENKNNSQSYTIPALITYPEITASQLEAEFTDAIIGTYKTNYSTSSSNRKENIRLAAAKINGKILNPGEVFSFNGIVGPRTAENGYKMAHVYVGSKTVDGIGGGICQVSSTLYNAVVFADLEIVYRTNHSMPVSYVPLGRDATVSYGSIDFKFKNNKSTPIKFEVIPDGNNLTVNIYGRKKYDKDITIENAITGSRAFSVVEEKDDTMYEDERVVVEKGSYGTNVETYKIVKENGKVVSRTLLAKSSYTPISQVEKVGTLKRGNTDLQPEDIENTYVPEPSADVASDAASSDFTADVSSVTESISSSESITVEGEATEPFIPEMTSDGNNAA